MRVASSPETPVRRLPLPQAAGLFSPLVLGELALAHRVVVGPWPLRRGLPRGVPTRHMADHYALRATPGGLVVCAPALVAPGQAGDGRPGLHAAEQVNHWRDVTDAVHARGAYAVAHLRHPGLAGLEHPATREAALEDYRSAAENAGDAGFDAVELDTAPGGAGPGLRFLGDAVHTLIGVWPPRRVGAWLAADRDAAGLAQALAGTGIGYLHAHAPEPAALGLLRRVFAGPLIVAVPGAAPRLGALDRGLELADALSFGEACDRAPDWVARLRGRRPATSVAPRAAAPLAFGGIGR